MAIGYAEEFVHVRFQREHQGYQGRDVAHFSLSEAEALVKAGKAVFCDKDGKVLEKATRYNASLELIPEKAPPPEEVIGESKREEPTVVGRKRLG
jgi:hypothetical protein